MGAYRKRSLLQALSELAILLVVVGLCTLAFTAQGAPVYIRKPVLTENLADPPRLLACLQNLVTQTGLVKVAPKFSGPTLSKDRRTASYLVLQPGLAQPAFRLDFAASPNQRWRYFTYGGDLVSRIGVSAGWMEPVGELVNYATGHVAQAVDLGPCQALIGH